MSFSILFLSLLGCVDSDNKGFSSLGQTSLDPNTMNPQGNSDNNTDTANPIEGENSDAPVLSSATAFFSQVTGVGDVIEIHLFFSDPQNDIDGGEINVSYVSSSESNAMTIAINGTDAIVEEGEVTFIFRDVNPAETYEFDITLVDFAGNSSNSIQAIATSTNE